MPDLFIIIASTARTSYGSGAPIAAETTTITCSGTTSDAGCDGETV
jgi:hypothetical protein